MEASKGLEIKNGKWCGMGTCKDKDIVLPDGVKSIGSYVYGKAKIKSLVIPDSVEYIEDSALASSRSNT